MNNEIIKFVNGDLQLDVTVSPDNETVWLNRNQIAQLFGRDIKTIGKHINNALKEELDDSTVAKFATVQTEGNRKIQRSIEYYYFRGISCEISKWCYLSKMGHFYIKRLHDEGICNK